MVEFPYLSGMKNELETLSKSELIERYLSAEKTVTDLDEKLSETSQNLSHANGKLVAYREEIQLYRRMLFGQKRERYVAADNQMSLTLGKDRQEEAARKKQHTEKISYVRRKAGQRKHPGRVSLPDHLPVEEIEIYPPGDLSGKVCIGTEITDKLEMVPAKAFIKRFIRYKYATRGDADQGVLIGDLPGEVVDKSIAAPSVQAAVMVDKYVDHLPLYRQLQRFSRHDITIAASTLGGWVEAGADRLSILYDHFVADVKAQGYLQVDETPVRVQDPKKKGSCHRGYYWVYYSPLSKAVLFDYQATRGRDGPERILDDFKGYLQTDGYGVYDHYQDQTGIRHIGCWAHARRYFEKALDNDYEQAGHAMKKIQELYEVERQARQEKLSPSDRKQLRLEDSLPVLDELGEWISEVGPQVLPQSPIGKAMHYTAVRWENLKDYLYDGHLEIDNNLVENQIRPLALGKKNWLFAGSHNAARRSGMIYTMMGNCKIHKVNPYEWLHYVLQHILDTRYEDVRSLYPQNFKSRV